MTKGYSLREKINCAINRLEKLSLTDMPVGKYIIDSETYFTIQEYVTRREDNCKYESHKKYIDVHYMICGSERIKVCSCEKLKQDTSYDSAADVSLWLSSENTMSELEMVLHSNSYVVLFPEHAHMPGLSVNNEIKVKKIVLKIRIE
ncbi:MAG: YhcH/YjgK/YiaL family protein [Ruminococcus sp.]|nr:YhcH/YjgK/YiaL family protein [Ruminococcus sp.]